MLCKEYWCKALLNDASLLYQMAVTFMLKKKKEKKEKWVSANTQSIKAVTIAQNNGKAKKQLSGCLFWHMLEKRLMPSYQKITSSKTLPQMKTPGIFNISSNNCCCCANRYMQKHTNYLSNITFTFQMLTFLTTGTLEHCCHKMSCTYQFLLTSWAVYRTRVVQATFILRELLISAFLCFCLWQEQQNTFHHKLCSSSMEYLKYFPLL